MYQYLRKIYWRRRIHRMNPHFNDVLNTDYWKRLYFMCTLNTLGLY